MGEAHVFITDDTLRKALHETIDRQRDEIALQQQQYHESIAWRDVKIAELRMALKAATDFIQSEVASEFHWTPERFAQAQAALDAAYDYQRQAALKR